MPLYANKYARTVLGGAEILANVASSTANQWYGRTTVASTAGGLSGVASTALVTGTSIVLATLETTSTGVVAVLPQLTTRIFSGSYIQFSTVGSFVYTGSYTATANWLLLNPARNW